MTEASFFGKKLRNNGAFWHIGIGGGMSVSLWIARPLQEPKPGWTAKLTGLLPHGRELLVQGRSAGEALRRLERRSLADVRRIVAVFAKLSNFVVLDFHKSRKKQLRKKKL